MVPTTGSPENLALGRAMRATREERGISQEALALKAGLHRNYYSSLERGSHNPSHLVILKIAEALDVKASELLARAGQ